MPAARSERLEVVTTCVSLMIKVVRITGLPYADAVAATRAIARIFESANDSKGNLSLSQAEQIVAEEIDRCPRS